MDEWMPNEYPRLVLDTAQYAARLQADNRTGRCFICDLVEDENNEPGALIYRDELCVVLFPNAPRLLGYTMLAPREHHTGVVADFTEDDYVALQRRVHRLGRALTALVSTERLYIFSFGSHQGVAHVHWHVVPLPPGVPFEEQQFNAVNRPDYLQIPAKDQAALAKRIAAAMASHDQ
ncbi:HIT family protein [Actinoallomurus sp. NPDC052274]|uniref:HIT family protein n=1 Tax=Actinoallomurus sp. NPDC052274 TaxID=3155420 RepID=UPI00343E895A